MRAEGTGHTGVGLLTKMQNEGLHYGAELSFRRLKKGYTGWKTGSTKRDTLMF